jgi:hypothetical protein
MRPGLSDVAASGMMRKLCYRLPATFSRRRQTMAKGQMRSNKEKKKPKADKDKPKQLSAYKAAQTSGGKK